MNYRQLEIIQHALGVDKYGQKPRGWDDYPRNHFCAGRDDEDVCRELVAMGLMENWPDPGYLPYYNCSVTEAGKKAMRNESPKPPKLTASQKRYREWLVISDLISFGSWLKRRSSK
jgi:hypothetical protein